VRVFSFRELRPKVPGSSRHFCPLFPMISPPKKTHCPSFTPIEPHCIAASQHCCIPAFHPSIPAFLHSPQAASFPTRSARRCQVARLCRELLQFIINCGGRPMQSSNNCPIDVPSDSQSTFCHFESPYP